MALRQNFFGKLALKSLSKLEEVPRHDPRVTSSVKVRRRWTERHRCEPRRQDSFTATSLDVGLGEPLRPWSGPVDPGTVTGSWTLS